MFDEVLVTGEEAARLVWKTTLDDMIKTEPIIDEATIRTQLRIQPFNLNNRWDRNMVFGAVFVAGYLQGVRRERIRQRLRRQKKRAGSCWRRSQPKTKIIFRFHYSTEQETMQMVNEKVFDDALKSMLDLPIDSTKGEAIIVVARLDTGNDEYRHVFTVKGGALSALHMMADMAETVAHSSPNPVMQALMRDTLRRLLSENGI